MTDPTRITLESADYPVPPESMLSFVPADLSGTVQLGPAFLDAETMDAFNQAVLAGQFTLDPAWSEALGKSNNAVLETKFLEHLRRTRLSPSSPALHHRRLALFEAVKDIGAAGTVPGFGFGLHNVTRAIGDVETWLEGKRQELDGLGMGQPEIVRMLAMLTPAQLAALLQVSDVTLANWREAKRGPAFAKFSQRSVRYPVAAVLAWLEEGLRG
jgi:hypothetical protein